MRQGGGVAEGLLNVLRGTRHCLWQAPCLDPVEVPVRRASHVVPIFGVRLAHAVRSRGNGTRVRHGCRSGCGVGAAAGCSLRYLRATKAPGMKAFTGLYGFPGGHGAWRQSICRPNGCKLASSLRSRLISEVLGRWLRLL